MKKISILLSVMLLAFAVSCSSPNKPDNSTDNSNNIPLSERAGKYTGTIADLGMSLEMALDNTGSLTSLKVNNDESLDPSSPIKVSNDPNSKSTVFGPFNATIKLVGNPANAQVKITFKSGTDKTLGASVDIDVVVDDGKFDPAFKNVILNYQAN